MRSSSASDSVQPESGCTPSAVVAFGEQHCRRTEPVLCSWPGLDRYLVKNSQCPAKASLVSRLTIRSSRDRFAASAGHGKIVARRGRKSARLSSGVSAQKKQISANSFLDKRHKSFSDPLLPALRHISDLIHLRTVSDLLASSQLRPFHTSKQSWLQRANNSFKPRPLRGLGVAS